MTSMFMHGGPAHLIFNMFALWSFGTTLETFWGSRRFLIFYFVAGMGSGLIFTAVNWLEFRSIYGDLVESGVSETVIRVWLKTNYFAPGGYPESVNAGMFAIRDLYHIHAVGASGAIYGVLVAFGFMFPNAKLMLIFLPVPVAAKYFIPGLLAFGLFFGLTGFSILGAHIAHFAHLGGAAVGFLFMWFWKKKLGPPMRMRPASGE
jgi:membrane associated rhomboid family serine protease